jgi:rRNA maturation endonuclease Nob1
MMQNTMGSAFAGGQQQPPQAVASTLPCAQCGNALPQGAKFCLECGQPVLAENEIVCTSCSAKTPKGKFCLECGAPMVKKCQGCGTEMPPNGKFCLECGQKV